MTVIRQFCPVVDLMGTSVYEKYLTSSTEILGFLPSSLITHTYQTRHRKIFDSTLLSHVGKLSEGTAPKVSKTRISFLLCSQRQWSPCCSWEPCYLTYGIFSACAIQRRLLNFPPSAPLFVLLMHGQKLQRNFRLLHLTWCVHTQRAKYGA